MSLTNQIIKIQETIEKYLDLMNEAKSEAELMKYNAKWEKANSRLDELYALQRA